MSHRLTEVIAKTLRAQRIEPSPPAPSGEGSATKVPLNLDQFRPEGMSWHDYLILLLQIGAELEHALMVQYLYAAYSIGGPGVAEEHRPSVRRWQETILTVAREEMGHLLTVQNLLVLLGGPLNFSRADYPWDSPFYPFTFQLEPLTLTSLACYVYAEMPGEVQLGKEAFTGLRPAGHKPTPQELRYNRFFAKDQKAIEDTVKRCVAPGMQAHHVDEIYEEIIKLVGDRTRIPDGCFNADSYDQQMSWDEFAKGYGPQVETPTDDAEPHETDRDPSDWPARVIVPRMATRSMALDALSDIAGQGEGMHLNDDTVEPSHFDRFLEVYQEMSDLGDVTVARAVVCNPSTRLGGDGAVYLEDAQTRGWGNLANLRYRSLLTYLMHMYQFPPLPDPNRPSARAGMLHRLFSEMYNLRAIAGMLVRMPVSDATPTRYAGLPFEMPYTLNSPQGAENRWRTQREIHLAGAAICDDLLATETSADGIGYLTTLRDLDLQSIRWIESMVGTSTGRALA